MMIGIGRNKNKVSMNGNMGWRFFTKQKYMK